MCSRMYLRNVFQKLFGLSDDAARDIKKSLRACGVDVSIRLPCVIEVPHRVEIYDNVSIASYLHVWGNGSVVIGPRTMIASHVAISSATHDPDSPEMYRTLIEAAVVIENDVWIGAHAVIFPGVVVGQHSVIAAGTIVRESVPAFSVVAGVPARIVRRKPVERSISPNDQ